MTVEVVEILETEVEVVRVVEAAGPRGDTGDQGVPGIDGAPGADGADGMPGAPGADGTNGAPGTPGSDGAPGVDGVPGTDGVDGAPGSDGAPGADGLPGVDGADGVPGADGAEGSTGPGVPGGGATGQVLAKVSGTDLDTAWADPPATTDASLLTAGTVADARLPVTAQAATLGATYAPTLGPRPYYLDAYNAFFLNAGAWVTGQGTTGTTLTAQATAGASVMAVTSGASFPNGTSIITNPGTATQQIYKVTAGGGTTSLTVTPNIVTTLANGATVLPLWTNSTHLTNPEGMSAWGYWMVNAKKADGSYVLTDPGPTRPVVILGDSWASQLGATFATHVHTRFPAATVVNVGVSGNTSTQMIARFATDVPTNAAFVYINEPGMNDIAGGVTAATMAANLETLIGLIRGIGATPIITGIPPLSDQPQASARRAASQAGQVGDGRVFPAQTAAGLGAQFPGAALSYAPEAGSIGIGTAVLGTQTTGVQNTALGTNALDAVTSGAANTCIGREAGTALTTGGNNTSVGHNAHRALATGLNNTAIGQGAASALTGSGNTAIGALAAFSMVAGTDSVCIGKSAGYAPNGTAANASTTAVNQTIIGAEAGLGSTAQANGIVAIGRRALVTGSSGTAIGTGASAVGNYSVAIGAGTVAGHDGGLAIGADNTNAAAATTAINQIAIGTALHTMRLPGWLQLDRGQATVGAAGAASALPATPTKYLSVKDSTGTEYVMPVYAKA